MHGLSHPGHVSLSQHSLRVLVALRHTHAGQELQTNRYDARELQWTARAGQCSWPARTCVTALSLQVACHAVHPHPTGSCCPHPRSGTGLMQGSDVLLLVRLITPIPPSAQALQLENEGREANHPAVASGMHVIDFVWVSLGNAMKAKHSKA
jgi:hypothetical protein